MKRSLRRGREGVIGCRMWLSPAAPLHNKASVAVAARRRTTKRTTPRIPSVQPQRESRHASHAGTLPRCFLWALNRPILEGFIQGTLWSNWLVFSLERWSRLRRCRQTDRGRPKKTHAAILPPRSLSRNRRPRYSNSAVTAGFRPVTRSRCLHSRSNDAVSPSYS